MWLPSSPFLPCVRTPGGPPARACTARASYGHGRVVRPAPSLRCLPTLPLCPRGGGGTVRPSLPSSPTLGGAEVCGGGGSLVVIPSLHACRRHDASTAQARGAAPIPLQGGGGHALWLPSSPFLPCVRTPGGPPAGACTARALYGHGRVVRPAPSRRCLPTLPLCPPGGGGAFRPPLPASPPLGGRRCVGGGGLSSSFRSTHVASTTQAWRRHEARHLSLCRGGGLAVCHPSSPLLPCVRTPGRAEVCGGGGGAPLSSSLRCTHVAGTTKARRKHGVRHLAAAGGGVSPLGLPALLHGIGSAPQDLQPLLPLGGSRHVSAWCSVSRACSLLCANLLEEVRTRVETDDEEVRAAGRTYRMPRRLLAPSAALVEGRAPVSAPNSPGGADCPSSPWCLCIHFRAA